MHFLTFCEKKSILMLMSFGHKYVRVEMLVFCGKTHLRALKYEKGYPKEATFMKWKPNEY